MTNHERNFWQAMNQGNKEQLTKLMKGSLFQKPVPIDFRNEQGRMAVFDIFDANKPEMLEWLINCGLNKNSKTDTGHTLLDMTLLYKWNQQLQYLLDIGTKLQGVYKYNSEFWDEYIYEKGEDNLLALVNAGVPCTKDKKSKNTPLCMAVEHNFTKLAFEMLERGALVNEKNRNQQTALHIAAKNNNVIIIQELIKRNADINVIDENEKTPLYIATENFKKGAVMELLKTKSNINALCTNRKTALHVACVWCDLDVIEAFINTGANVNAVSAYTLTPLHIAAEYDKSIDSIILNKLITAGANIFAVDYNNKTPLQIAQESHNENAFILLGKYA